MCLTGHATGGGTFGCYCVRNGGGGDTKKFFEKAIVFGVFHRSCQNAKNYQLFEKIFRVPPRCEHSNTQMSPPPVACPVRHLTTNLCPARKCLPLFANFTIFFLEQGAGVAGALTMRL